LLERAPKERVAIDDLYVSYATTVKPEDKLAPGEFIEQAARFCKQLGIEISGKHLIGIRLVTPPGATASIPSTTSGTRGARGKVSG
jgi:hypothetical protein